MLGKGLMAQACAIEDYAQRRPAFNAVGRAMVETFSRSANAPYTHCL
ncbi:hypothetical protein IMCC21906_00139 [Spongiibacter sp. IMCC21906]|nr:hypothetical protein IMCC21906_00139 [Spongiibacter sp. IMCC21906]